MIYVLSHGLPHEQSGHTRAVLNTKLNNSVTFALSFYLALLLTK